VLGDAPPRRAKAANIIGDDTILPLKALGLNLAAQLKSIMAAGVPALEQVGFIGIEQRGVASPSRLAFGKGRGLKILFDGATVASHLSGDGFHRPSLLI
jgi:hypothetical protein